MLSNASALDIAQMSARRLKSLSIQLDDTGLDDEARLEGGEAVTRRKLAADAGTAPDPGAMEGSLAATFPTTSKIG
ncbi:hypothetical protein X726_30685 [Mesorhizobium sp. L103C105A0]|nr:hypothetical protein X726_30685 [Mesorhizobium sp. L103C105A0]